VGVCEITIPVVPTTVAHEGTGGQLDRPVSRLYVPEISNVMTKLGMRFQQITGVPHDDAVCWREVEEWLRAGEIVRALEHCCLGLMGYYYSGMLDVGTDLVQVSGRFEIHLEMLEVDQLTAFRQEVDPDDVQERVEVFRSVFGVDSECHDDDLVSAARTSLALDRMAREHSLGMMAYYYKGSGVRENADTVRSIIFGTSLLTPAGVPVAGEYEVKNVVAMKILDLLGAGGSFTEYYAVDFNADTVLMGHDGPGHPGIASSKLRIRPLHVYHGKVGRGLFIETSVRHGAVTLLSLVEDYEHGFKLLIAGRGERARRDPENQQHQQPLPVPDWSKKIYRVLECSGPGTSLRCRIRPPWESACQAGVASAIAHRSNLLNDAIGLT